MNEFAKEKKDIYKTSRLMYIFEACFEYLISIMLGGVYLAKLTKEIGISDGTTAILSTVASLGAVFQVVSIMLSRKRPYKRWVIPVEIVTQSLLGALYIIPFLKINANFASVVFFIVMFSGFAIKSIISPIKSNWFMGLAQSRRRGLFQSALSGFSIFGQIFMEIVLSFIIDKYESQNNIKGAFVIITVLIFTFTLLNMIFLLCSREKPVEKEEIQSRKSNIKYDLQQVLKNKLFIKYVILGVIATIATALYNPFLGTYQISELDFSMKTVAFIQTARNILNIVLLAILGRLSLKINFLVFMKIGYFLKAVAILMIVFTEPSNGVYMFVTYNFIDVLATSFICISGTCIYSIVTRFDRVSALAVHAIVIGLVNFFVTLFVTPLFNYIKDVKGSFLFGRTVYAQQFLAGVSVIVSIVLLVYIFFVFSKQVKKTDSIDDEVD